MRLSVIIPSLNGDVPESLRRQVAGHPEVEVMTVVGVTPVGKARNAGIAKATGDYIAWVDGDDEVADDWLASILAALAESPDALIFDAKNEGWACMDDFVYGKADGDEVVRDVYENECLQGHLWRTVTRRKLWDGLRFDETICALEDFLLLPQVLLHAKTVRYLPKKLYRYVYHSDSAIGRASLRRIEDALGASVRRWQEAPAEYRAVALKGSLRLAYETLLTLKVDPAFRQVRGKPNISAGVRFVRRYAFSATIGGRERLRYLCAGLGFWLPQRLAYRCHFGRSAS